MNQNENKNNQNQYSKEEMKKINKIIKTIL